MGKHKSVFGKVSRVGKKERMQRIVFSNAKEWNLLCFHKEQPQKMSFPTTDVCWVEMTVEHQYCAMQIAKKCGSQI